MLTWTDILKFVKGHNPAPDKIIKRPEYEWKELLTPEVFHITRLKGTERPFSSELCTAFSPGLYACACCDALLFDASEKFESKSGWPSFTQPYAKNAIAYELDESLGMQRVEVACNTCEAHLGHVFPDGPEPSGLRYCINALSITKRPEEDSSNKS